RLLTAPYRKIKRFFSKNTSKTKKTNNKKLKTTTPDKKQKPDKTNNKKLKNTTPDKEQKPTKKLDIIIIGGMKCGSTTLHKYLEKHHNIYMSYPLKEPRYYLPFEVAKRYFDKATSLRVESREDLYKNYMLKNYNNEKLFGESSTDYTNTDNAVKYNIPLKISEDNPNIGILYIIRNPLDRIVSTYLHNKKKGRLQDFSFSNYIKKDIEGSNFVLKTSMYYYQISNYLKYFPNEQIKIIIFEEFIKNTKEIMNEVFDFLGIERIDNIAYNEAHNVSKNRSLFDEDELKFDDEYYESFIDIINEDVKKMSDFLGRDLFEIWDLSKGKWCRK
ncbi:MAG: sulfotransferase domain-containing protein, partial [bacterium]